MSARVRDTAGFGRANGLLAVVPAAATFWALLVAINAISSIAAEISCTEAAW